MKVLLNVVVVVVALATNAIANTHDANRIGGNPETGQVPSYNRPTIGVVTSLKTNEDEYLDAAVVMWLLSAGAEVVPIQRSFSDSTVKFLLSSVNGVLLPGGGKIDKFFKLIYKESKKFNKKGTHYPLWAINQGYDTLVKLVDKNEKETKSEETDYYSKSTNIFKNHFYKSRSFREMESSLMQALAYDSIVSHREHGIPFSKFMDNKKLSNFFYILMTVKNGKKHDDNDLNGNDEDDNNQDKNDQFVTTIEGKKFPFFATTMCPEKPAFIWSINDQSEFHSTKAIEFSHFLANQFISEVRRNSHGFLKADDADKYSIFRHSPMFLGRDHPDGSIEQAYVFGRRKPIKVAEELKSQKN